jgi:long-chain acyl-CoA synthetase
MASLPDLLLAAERRFGARPALAVRRGLRTEAWSYGELVRAAGSAATRLSEAGVRPGDRVLVLAPNSPELVASMFGVWLAGAILVPIDLRTPPAVLAKLRERTQPRLLLAGADADVPRDLPSLSVWTLGRPADHPARAIEPGTPASSPAELVFTSGTTGLPKGVVLTHANIAANVRAALGALPIKDGERVLSLLPLSHMLEQTAGLLAPLAAGATIYYPSSRRSTAILAALQRHRIGLLVCVPEVLRLLLAGIEREVDRTGRRRRWDLLVGLAGRLPMPLRPALFGPVHRRLGGALRLVLCGGAALDPDLWRTWEQLGVRVIQGYGATECAPIVTSNRFDHRLPGAVGWPVQGVEVRLAPDGEVLVRGPNVTPGYWRDPSATEAAFTDGWYRTGDVGAFGSQGELRLLGRKKEMIVLADGRNVFPRDVEDALRREPAVRDCVVVGRPRAGGGEEVHAVLIPAESEDAARVAVRTVNGRLGPHQQISGVTIWTAADFPRTPSLKVKRAEVLSGLARPSAAHETAPAALDESLEARVRTLIARAAERPLADVLPQSDLVLDLGLDSLARVELAVLLEEDLGQSVPDAEVAALHTVADVVAAVQRGAGADVVEPLPRWPRARPIALLRALLQDWVLFPALRLVCRPRTVLGGDVLGAAASGPVLVIANHTSHLDAPSVLSLVPPARRRRLAVAAAADYFFSSAPRAWLASVALGAFPFHREGAVAASLGHCGDLADDGYGILIFPEGTRSPDGRLQPFKAGVGLLARELGLPVVPVHLAGLHAILPKGRTWPRPGPVRITVGSPVAIDASLTNAEVAAVLEQSMRELAQAASTTR